MTDTENLTPHDALRLIEKDDREHQARRSAPVPAILLTWGVAWILIYGALWAAGGPIPALGGSLAAVAVLVVAVIISGVLGARTGRGIRPSAHTAFTGAVYGSGWTIGILGLGLIGVGLHAQGMSDQLLLLYAAVGYAFVSGFQYVMAAAIWHAVPSLLLGVWTVVLAAASAVLGVWLLVT